MKRVLFALCLLLPLMSQAQKRHEFTFCFNNPDSIKHFGIEYLDPDYNGAEINLSNKTLLTYDEMIAVTFVGRSTDGRGGVFKTGWPEEDGTFDHHLFIARGGGMRITAKQDAEIDAVTFSTDTYTGNLALVAPLDKGTVSPVNFSWNSRGSSGAIERTDLVEYTNNGQLPEIRAFTVVYYSPMDVLAPVSVTPADKSEMHSIETIEIAYDQPIKLGEGAKFELTGPRGFNPVKMIATLVDNTVVLSLPEGVTIDESNEARRGTYTLTIAEMSIIGDDADEYYNKKTVYTFNVVEAFNKFDKESVYPDDQVEQVTEIPNGIVIGFAGGIGKFSSDEIKLVDRDGNPTRTMQAQWLDENEYVEGAPFYKHDKDIYNFVKFVFTGSKTAAVKATGLYHFTVPEGFIWNDKWDSTAEDEGVSAGARFNPEFTIEYNVNGVVYPSDEVLQAAKDLLEVTGAGYPAADSPARVALQNLVTEGIGADAVFQAAMEAFYAETQIELPSDGYYLLSAVPAEGDELYISYENGKIGLTNNENDAVHLFAKVNEDGTIVFKTPDNKYLTRLAPTGSNISDTYEAKKNNFTFTKLEVEGKTAQDLFGLWIINAWLRSTDEGVDKTAYALVNFQTNAFATSDERENRYFDEVLSNAFRLTETLAPIPAATYTFDPASGTALETLHRVELTFTNIAEVKMVENAKALITLVGSNALKYAPDQVTAVSGSKNKFLLSFEDVKAGTYTLTIPKGVFTWTYDGREATIQEITATYTVKSGVDFSYDFIFNNAVYYYNRDLNQYIRDVDMNELVLETYKKMKWGISNKQVLVQDVDDVQVYSTGHFVAYPGFVDPNVPDATAIKLVLDKPIKRGDMPPGVYTYVIAPATFGDENFGKWLADPQSLSKNDCHVNSELRPNILVDNDKANISFTPALNSFIESFSEVTITFPYATNVTIAEGMKLTIQNTFDNSEIDATIEPVEGKKNAFRFTSTEPLKGGSWEGEYMITIPVDMFKCTDAIGDFTVPSYYAQQFWFYGRPNGDAIDDINVQQQSNVIYDLSGRRVKDTNKNGIYIVNGKKVVVK